jgi:UDP-N-acetylglucosamine:LPS N-acetylglucosamine transferase
VLLELLQDPERRSQMAMAVAALARPQAALYIAEELARISR